ncbi:adult cuticle protein 1-like [Stomoxys calcitrans]|uniref:Adult cuticle protein 1 n=1 Tax=Stomoxys calcitrans TaxID=35570 RepID=A0A1I8NXW6_STOCA|nr:adult cuticle protein 1 [Stomoxys calcitrans]XP_059220193.1 adult cuticle protein 1-like [Stomoxys calcitrans]
MKFLGAVLSTLALALGVQSSVLPVFTEVAGGGLSYTAVSSPVLPSPWAAWPHAAVAVHAAVPSVAVHAPVAVPAPAPVVVPAVQGSYVAQTRGAVHTAPLAGHVNSVANVNLAPAPGTL